VYMQQRYDEPLAGRFLSVDPVTTDAKTGDHFNRFLYANNNPYRFVDPDGEAPRDAGPGSGGGGSAPPTTIGTGSGGYGSSVRSIGSSQSTSATAVNSQAARADQLSKNVGSGKAGEAATRTKLGDKAAGEQVSFKTSDGTRARTDFVTTDKGVVETKTGSAQLSRGQAKLKADIDAGRDVTPVGQNAANAGLRPNEPTRMSCCIVDRPKLNAE